MFYFIGLDISKTSIDVCYLEGTNQSYKRYDNSSKGHKLLAQDLKDKEDISLVVCEPTGGYEKPICKVLRSNHYPIHLVNTISFSNFSKSVHPCKTDRLDAYKLALYGQKFNPDPNLNLGHDRLKALQQRREDLVKMLSDEKRRLEHATDEVRLSLDQHIQDLNRMIKDLNDQIQAIIEEDQALKCNADILISTPGIGQCIASKLLSHLPELGHESYTANKLAALIGVAPYTRDSGTKSGYRFTRGGRKIPRDSLYLAVLTGKKSIPCLNDLYNRIVEKGKPKKVAIVACMRKLLAILHALIKQKRAFKTCYER